MLSRFSRVWLFATPWTVARQAPLSTGFSGQEYRSGLPFPTPRDLPDPEIEPMSLMSLALADGFFTTSATWEAPREYNGHMFCLTSLCAPSSLIISSFWLYGKPLLVHGQSMWLEVELTSSLGPDIWMWVGVAGMWSRLANFDISSGWTCIKVPGRSSLVV